MRRLAYPEQGVGSQIPPLSAIFTGIIVIASKHTSFLFPLFLAAAVAAVYYPLLSNSYIYLDDTVYVFSNPVIQKGFSLEGLLWSLSPHADTHWQPLTWFSHMLDVQLFGLDPSGHHLSSLLFHVFNTLLVYHFLNKATEKSVPSFFAAVLFALHPLQVETVAWIAERKSILSCFFGLLCLVAYTSYGKEKKKEGYVFALIFLAMSLMAKSALMIMPLLLLLLDFWPFERCRNLTFKEGMKLILEKVPFFLVSAAAFTGIFLHLKIFGLVHEPDRHVLSESLANGFYSYLACIGRFFRPVNLAPLYSYPETLGLVKTASIVAVILFISVLFIARRKQSPHLAFGWYWYLIALLPMAGFVPIGIHAMTDHYMYLPVLGLCVMAVWVLYDVSRDQPVAGTGFILAGVAIVFLLGARSKDQLKYWKNSETLFEQILKVSPDNHLVHYNLGGYLTDQKRYGEAIDHYRISLELFPDNSATLTQLGRVYAMQNRSDEAYYYLEEAVKKFPENTTAVIYLGDLNMMNRRPEKALEYYEYCLKINPGLADAYLRKAEALMTLNRNSEAAETLKKLLQIKPSDETAKRYLGAL